MMMIIIIVIVITGLFNWVIIIITGLYNVNLRALQQWSFCSLQPSTMYRNQFRAGFHRKKLASR